MTKKRKKRKDEDGEVKNGAEKERRMGKEEEGREMELKL